MDSLNDDDPGFTDWLRDQVHRDDVVGDLARDFLEDGVTTLPQLHGAALLAYERAIDEFRGSR